jgi:hypothetical protein
MSSKQTQSFWNKFFGGLQSDELVSLGGGCQGGVRLGARGNRVSGLPRGDAIRCVPGILATGV